MARFVALSGSVVLFLSVVGWSSELASPVSEPLFGEWNRLNTRYAGGNPSNSEHELMHFWVEAQVWSGSYEKHPEPALGFPNPPDGTFGIFTGTVATNFVCQPAFPFYPCQDVVQVVEGMTRYSPLGRPPFDIHQQHIIVRERNGHEVMWQYFVSPGNFVCPWYRDFEEALAAAPSTAHGDCIFQVRSQSDPEQTERIAERTNRAIAQRLDIDYKRCSTVILRQQMGQLAEDDVAYVSIIGEDPDATTLNMLRKLHARVEPGSKTPSIADGEIHSHTWFFAISFMRPVAPREYVAGAGYHCGALCAGATEYRLSKSGKSCSVLSSRLLWVS